MPTSSKPPPPPPAASPPDIAIVGDTVSLHPSGYDAPPVEQNLIDNMARFRSAPIDFLREVSLYVSGTGWRSYDKVVGQPIFYSGFSEKMKARILGDPRVGDCIRRLAEQRAEEEDKKGTLMIESDHGRVIGRGPSAREKRTKEIEKQLRDVADTMAENMICKMESKRFIRGAYYLCTQLLTRAYHQGIHVSSEEVLRLRAVAEKAAKEKQSIIFLPCHRSHVDYVSLQLICFRLGLALPTVVSGDNLNFPLVGSFLQHAGAFWIRRSFGDDQLYVTMVQAYVDALLKNGFNFECFIEGTRSRTGKLLPPKFGILSFLLDSVLSGRVKDAIVCPVSTQYDKVIEVDSYISELLGQPKSKENLMDFLSASSILSLKLGRVDVRFHEPWSLRGFIEQQQQRFKTLPMQIDDKEMRLRLLRTMGYRVLSEINEVSVVMPTALVGTVLLTLRGRGVGKSELVRRVEWLCDRVRSQGGRVAHFAGLPTTTVVERALDVLGPQLVGCVSNLPEETYYAVDRFQLSFYRNMTIHLFILEALVSAGMYTKVKLGGGPEMQRISFPDLRDQVYFLSQLFRGEFIFPTEGLDVNLDKTLRGLERDNVIKVTRASGGGKTHTESEPAANNASFTNTAGNDSSTPTAAAGTSTPAKTVSGPPGTVQYVELSDAERELGRENYDFYCFLIWPFIEASWLGAVSLMMLTPPADAPDKDAWFEVKKVQDRAQLLGKTLYHQGDLSYFEAVNKETLKNAYQRFEEEGIIEVSKSRDSRVAPTLRLAKEWMPERYPTNYHGANGNGSGNGNGNGNGNLAGHIIPHGRLWDFAERISASRREGKNRRDGQTVKFRVLALVDLVAKPLFEAAPVVVQDEDDTPPQPGELNPKKKRRRRSIQSVQARL